MSRVHSSFGECKVLIFELLHRFSIVSLPSLQVCKFPRPVTSHDPSTLSMAPPNQNTAYASSSRGHDPFTRPQTPHHLRRPQNHEDTPNFPPGPSGIQPRSHFSDSPFPSRVFAQDPFSSSTYSAYSPPVRFSYMNLSKPLIRKT